MSFGQISGEEMFPQTHTGAFHDQVQRVFSGSICCCYIVAYFDLNDKGLQLMRNNVVTVTFSSRPEISPADHRLPLSLPSHLLHPSDVHPFHTLSLGDTYSRSPHTDIYYHQGWPGQGRNKLARQGSKQKGKELLICVAEKVRTA